MAVACELIAYFIKSKILSVASLVNGVAAAITALAAVTTGLLAESLVPATGDVRTVFESHETLGFLTLAAAFGFAGLKTYSHLKQTDRFIVAQVAIGLIGVIVTILAAHEGGELVYRHRVGITKDSAQTKQNQFPMTTKEDPYFDSQPDTSRSK